MQQMGYEGDIPHAIGHEVEEDHYAKQSSTIGFNQQPYEQEASPQGPDTQDQSIVVENCEQQFENGSVYKGSMKKGKRHGFGV